MVCCRSEPCYFPNECWFNYMPLYRIAEKIPSYIQSLIFEHLVKMKYHQVRFEDFCFLAIFTVFWLLKAPVLLICICVYIHMDILTKKQNIDGVIIVVYVNITMSFLSRILHYMWSLFPLLLTIKKKKDKFNTHYICMTNRHNNAVDQVMPWKLI